MEPRVHLDLVKAFLKALSDGESGAALERFYHPNAVQTEYPNALTKVVTERNLAALREASERGKAVIRRQNYELVKAHVAGDVVIIEALWTAELNIPLGKLAAGDTMKAWFAKVYEFRDGKISVQRNYDCFEPFV